jgi:hypothetical protein
MAEQSIEMYMLQNIQAEQKRTSERLNTLDDRVFELGQEVGQLRGTTSPPIPTEKPWWLSSIVGPLIVAVVVAIVGTLITLLVKVSRIEGELHDNAGFIAGLRLQQNANDPTSPQNAADVRQVLENAKNKRFKIPPDVVKITGVKFVQAAQTNSNAWNAALALVDYHSSQNHVTLSAKPAPLSESEVTYHTHYDVAWIGPPGHAYTVTPLLPQYEAATVHFLDKPDHNANVAMGPSFLVLEDSTYLLDSLYFRRVIFRNSRIVYKGGPVVLDNVTFVNCTFEITQQPNGLSFATVFLESPLSVTFKADAESRANQGF